LRAARRSLFQIPEEVEQPAELAATDQYLADNLARPYPGFIDAVVRPVTNALARAMATARHGRSAAIEAARAERVEQALLQGPEKLSEPERIRILDDPQVLGRLHEAIWHPA